MSALLKGSLVVLMLLVTVAGPARAQWGLGVKLTPLARGEVFASYGLLEPLRAEVGVAWLKLGWGGEATLKLYLGRLEWRGGALRPFAGAGLFMATALGLHRSSARGVVGLDYDPAAWPLGLVGELTVSAPGFQLRGLRVGGQLGLRWDF